MISLFDKRLKDLEAEVEALKTASLIGTTALTTTSKTIQVHVDFEHFLYPSGYEDTQSKKIAIIEITPEDGGNFLDSIGLVSGQNQMKNRRCILRPSLEGGKRAYMFAIAQGSNADLEYMRNGGQISFDLTFRVTCTSDFSLNVTYRDW